MIRDAPGEHLQKPLVIFFTNRFFGVCEQMCAVNVEPVSQQHAGSATRFARARSFQPARAFGDGFGNGRHDKQNAL